MTDEMRTNECRQEIKRHTNGRGETLVLCKDDGIYVAEGHFLFSNQYDTELDETSFTDIKDAEVFFDWFVEGVPLPVLFYVEPHMVLVGRVYDDDWDFQGIFSQMEVARTVMLDDSYFAAYVLVDEMIPHESMTFPDMKTPADVDRILEKIKVQGDEGLFG